MKVLTLFSGTHSVGKALKQSFPYWSEVTLDVNYPSTHRVDVLMWDHTVYKPGHFDIIWASPDCTQFSKARYNCPRPRDLEHADAMVLKTLEIIDYLKPKYWVLENPETGLLKKRVYMFGRPYAVVDYCMYGYNFRKRTALWSNIAGELSSVLLTCNKACGAFIDGKHVSSIECSYAGKKRGMIPTPLLVEIFSKIESIDGRGRQLCEIPLPQQQTRCVHPEGESSESGIVQQAEDVGSGQGRGVEM